ncbi:MAG: hypothetical protein RLZZ252_238 [Bacteroidota bacterium]|jgi:bacillithiol system protein YtxJ
MDSRWLNLTEPEQLKQIVSDSNHRTQVLFKHSTRCSISTMALNRLKSLSDDFYLKADFYYLDLIAYRNISNAIAEDFHVFHESPQVIVIKNGEAIFDASHMEITTESLLTEL